jgi:hypothetical protein
VIDLDPSTIATRGDVEMLLAPGPDGPLGTGWRAGGRRPHTTGVGRAALAFQPGSVSVGPSRAADRARAIVESILRD